MKLLTFQFLVVFAIQWICPAEGDDGNYVVTAPKEMWAGYPYKIHVLLRNVQMPTTVTLQLLVSEKGASVSTATLSFSVPGTAQVATLTPPINPPEHYTSYFLSISYADGDSRVQNSVNVPVNYQDSMFLIQTDKGLYKAGQTVRIRVLHLTKDLLPKTGSVTIKVKTPDGIVLQQYKNVTLNTGVASAEFLLSDEPQNGTWLVMAEDSSNYESSSMVNFEVDNYVLPRFEVIIDGPPVYVADGGQAMGFNASAEYTYGEKVVGYSDCKVMSERNPNPPRPYQEVLINGQSEFHVDPIYLPTVESKVMVNCSVTEKGSGVTLSNSITIPIVPSMVNITLIGEESYTQGTPYILCVRMKDIYGRLVTDPSYSVRIEESSTRFSASVALSDFNQGIYCQDFSFKQPSSYYIVVTLYKGSTQKLVRRKEVYMYTAYSSSTATNNLFNIIAVANAQDSCNNIINRTPNHSVHKEHQEWNTLCTPTASPKRLNYTGSPTCRRSPRLARQPVDQSTPRKILDLQPPSFQHQNKSSNISIPGDGSLESAKEGPAPKSQNKSFNITIPRDGSLESAKEGPASKSQDKRPVSKDHVTAAGDNAYFQIHMAHDKDEAVDSNIFYEVYVQGSLHSHGTVQDPRTDEMITITTSNAMMPEALLFAYMISNNTLIVDWCKFIVSGNLANSVSASFNKVRAKVRETVDLTIRADADSYFGVVAIDKGSKLLKDPNSITFQKVIAKLAGFDMTSDSDSWYRYEVSTGEKLQNSGVMYMTNAYVKPKEDIYERVMFEVVAHAGAADSVPESSNGQEAQTVSAGSDDKVRKNFPETWMWFDGTISSDGSYVLSSQVPDSITSWYTQVFAIHPTTGLGIAPDTQIETFLEMFIALELPAVAKRNEIFSVKVLVFQYLENMPDQVAIRLYARGSKEMYDVEEYSGISASSKETLSDGSMYFDIIVYKGVPQVILFNISPKVVGDIELFFEATLVADTNVKDSLLKTITVKPEGNRVEDSQSIFLQSNASSSAGVALNFPNNTVPDSRKLIVSVIGDTMGQALVDPGKLVQLPFGCGEQNIASTVPNIFVKDYLSSIRQAVPSLEDKMNRNIQLGCQKELKYTHPDGSFSAFGTSDESGSTWLTAFVIKSFAQAEKVLPFVMDVQVIEKALTWLFRQHDGSVIQEPGMVIHSDYKSEVADSLPRLTAFVTSCMAEARRQYSDTMDQGIKNQLETLLDNKLCPFMEGHYSSGTLDKTDPYALALFGYSLAVSCNGASTVVDQIYSNLLSIATNATTADSPMAMICWNCKDSSKKAPGAEEPMIGRYYSYKPPSSAVEISGYVLMMKLAQLGQGNPSTLDPIIRWLNTQRNGLGGFSSTQNTVIGLQAMAQYATAMNNFRASYPFVDATAIFTLNNGSQTEYSFKRITQENRIVEQRYMLPSDLTKHVSSVRVVPNGNTNALATVTWRYNVLEEVVDITGKLKLTAKSYLLTKDTETLRLCVKMDGGNDGMGLLTVNMPTNYVSLPEKLQKNSYVRRYDITGEDVVIYVDQFYPHDTCIEVDITQVRPIEKIEAAQAKAELYYEPSVSTSVLYNPSDSVPPGCLNDVCSGADKVSSYSLTFISTLMLAAIARILY